jgi:tRNA (guanosine-2'-O-)-methyltransferase
MKRIYDTIFNGATSAFASHKKPGIFIATRENMHFHILSNLDRATAAKLGNHLAEFVTAQKLASMARVLAERTRAVTVVLEDIFQPHNTSAVIRSCECIGVQDVHVIENQHPYTVNRDVVMGAVKWIDLHRYNLTDGLNTERCLKGLKARGYRIVATALGDDTTPLPEIPVDANLAVVFGTEETGLSEAAQALSEYRLKIPMYGFTQSFNISVSAALCLYDICGRMRATRSDWQLTEDESKQLELTWLMKTVRNSEIVARRFLDDIEERA